MANDDYFLIVYKILDYLYKKFKEHKEVTEKELARAVEAHIVVGYWEDILKYMQEEGLIKLKGNFEQYICEDEPEFVIESVKITHKGMEYLQDNSLMKKASSFIKDVIIKNI